MRTTGLAKLALVTGLVSVLVGCTSLFKPHCIAFLADALEKEFEEQCGGNIDNCSGPTPQALHYTR